MTTGLTIAISVAVGWALRGAFDALLMRIAAKLFTSAAGRKAVLAQLSKGIAELEDKA